MTARIARHEFVRLLRDGRLRICAVLLALLFLLALITGFLRQRELAAAQSAAEIAERARWLGQPEKNPHSAAHYGVYVFKPRLAPGFLDPGIEPFSGIAVWLEAHKQNDLLFRPAEDATIAQRFGDLTVAVVLQILAPLLVLLLCFGAFAQEREQGTLRQLLSLGVPPRALVTGKLLGHLGALALGIAPLLLGTALVFRAARGGMSGAEWSRLCIFLSGYAVFLGTVALGALGISARASSPRAALSWLLALWVASCLLAPRALSELAGILHPIPSSVALKQELEARLGDPHAPNPGRAAFIAKLLKEYGVSSEKDLPINPSGLELQLGEERGNQVFDEVLGRLFDRYEEQNRLLLRGALLCPLLGLQSLSQAMAGTDFSHHRSFIWAAEEHRRLIQRLMNGHVMRHRASQSSFEYTAGGELWASVPPFRYEPPSVLSLLRAQAFGIFMLLAWLVAAALYAWRGAARLTPQ